MADTEWMSIDTPPKSYGVFRLRWLDGTEITRSLEIGDDYNGALLWRIASDDEEFDYWQQQ